MLVNRRVDNRTRRDRMQRNTDAWKVQMESLVDAYLVYEWRGAPTNEDEANYPAISFIDILGVYLLISTEV